MRFLRPSLGAALPPLLLILFALLPIGFLRQFFYGLLAVPLMPLIQRLGLLYRDKGFLTPAAAIVVAVVWAFVLYLSICILRSH
jgi:hypothetical protein